MPAALMGGETNPAVAGANVNISIYLRQKVNILLKRL